MDRYSRMQELSRALAESVSDLTSLHASLDTASTEAEGLLQQQGRIITEVQQALMGTLMVPFSRQVQRLSRVVRQTAEQNAKLAQAEFSGAESELDRNVLERMTAPLEHLLRNSVVHGIEDAQTRQAAGKSPEGTVHVSLKREGSQLQIEVRDDGRGLDFEAIRAQAVKKGLMRADAQVPNEDLARFIFAPGFSTARALTQDAGRGIGMDVVAAEVKQLGGTVDVASESGKGARFRIRLPLMLAVSQALVVQVGEELFAIPLSSVEGIARAPRESLAEMMKEGGRPLEYGGRQYDVLRLGELVGLPAPVRIDSRTVPAVLMRLGDGLGGTERRVAVVAERLIGNREIVTKPAGPILGSVSGVSGATILADGRVMLIVDIPALIADATRRRLGDEAALAPAVSAESHRLIMVVDDSITIRRVTERLLTRKGYRVITAKDGLDAMATLQTETPDAVLLDIEMPRADGFEVAAFIRNTPRIAGLPIIMITSRSGDKHREHARSLGVNKYLIKPYQEDQLLAELRDQLAAQAEAQTA
jgi:chemosensory pili system protein ChpA (sensor histidine kinase/response regulator)